MELEAVMQLPRDGKDLGLVPCLGGDLPRLCHKGAEGGELPSMSMVVIGPF